VLRRKDWSLMRALMYERLATVELAAPVLDIGGGAAADYNALLDCSPVSVNIQTALGPSVIGDVTGGLPFADASFAAVLAINTLEHLLDDAATLSECFRVLRPGGVLHAMTPFLYRVHGHPDDYHRHTGSAWAALLASAGFDSARIEPLVWDTMSTAWSLVDAAPLGRNWWRARRVLRPLVLARPLVFGRIDRRMKEKGPSMTADYPVAYYAMARR